MTPAERARQIDKEEFEAECAAIRQRAISYAARRRLERRTEFLAAINREPVKFIPRRWKAKAAPAATPQVIDVEAAPAPEPVTVTVSMPIKAKPVVVKQPKPEKVKQPKPIKLKQPKPVVIKAKKPKAQPKRFTVDGLTLSKTEWAKHLGITYGALMVRMSRLGSLEAAIKLDKKREAFNVNGKTVTEWAEHFGLARSVLYRRIKIDGSAERVINELIDCPPVVYRHSDGEPRVARTYTFDGKTLTAREWSTITGLHVRTLRSRISTGWTIEHALTTPANMRPGVASNFAPSSGTGAGSTAQETPNITFSGNDA
ncbi:hypothetical protein [Shinella zoogloeoides]|uniref:hypothetical protein n=1 Tax=Shinella zoogloeoides TaxID=352475 RepID=UPI000E65A663|nr:hypothetical protein [Shinella zoogloeoides]